jgi:hypothetical protein
MLTYALAPHQGTAAVGFRHQEGASTASGRSMARVVGAVVVARSRTCPETVGMARRIHGAGSGCVARGIVVVAQVECVAHPGGRDGESKIILAAVAAALRFKRFRPP